MADLTVFEWMEVVRPNKAGLSSNKKIFLKSMREQVLAKAGTTWNTLTGAKFRQAIGEELYNAVKDATSDLPEGYRITVEHKDLSLVAPDKLIIKAALKKLNAARDLANNAIEKLSAI